MRCLGKGRKARATPLTSQTVAALHAWTEELRGAPESPLFPSRRRAPLSRDAVEKLVDKYARATAEHRPSLLDKAVSPHVLRHSTAMALLGQGVDTAVIALLARPLFWSARPVQECRASPVFQRGMTHPLRTVRHVPGVSDIGGFVKALRVAVTDTLGYWTVVDDDWQSVPVADAYLRHLRFGVDRAKGRPRPTPVTSRCSSAGASRAGGTACRGKGPGPVRGDAADHRDRPCGSGRGRSPQPRRINHVLTAVRECCKHAVARIARCRAGVALRGR